MPTTVLKRQRSWVAIFAALAMFVSVLAIATPAEAALADTSLTCPDSIPSAGYTDLQGLDAATVHAIDCVTFYSISKGVGTGLFAPNSSTPRWQMALFLTRTADVMGITLPDGADQGFLDIATKDAETQKAINQIAQLDVSKGTSATTFDPDGIVSRWQMALFLTRLLDAGGITLPDGADQGFLDIATKDAETQKAINQTVQLGVSNGTSATVFSPDTDSLRWHMALFLTRTGAVAGVLPPGASLTAGPELIQVLRTDSDADDSEVTFLFSEDVTASSINDADFSLVDWAGNLTNDTGGLAKSSSVDNAVGGVWDNDLFDNAVAGNVLTDAVEDLSGNSNPVKSRSLNSVTVDRADYEPTLTQNLPELLSVDNFDPDTDEVDFTFDVDIDDAWNTDEFYLILDDGTVEQATSVCDNACITGAVATVEFNGLSSSEFNNVVRAFVAWGAVGDEDYNNEANPPMAIDVSGGGDVDTGEGPNIDSVDLSGLGSDGEVVFTFDRNVADSGGEFCITYFNVNWWVTDCDNPGGGDVDGDEVTATFTPFSGDVVIYATVLDDAVEDDLTGKAGQPDTEHISHSFAAGETAGPDLVSVAVSGNLAGSKITVTITFDEDVETGWAPFSFVAFDDDGDEVDISGYALEDDDGDATIKLVYVPGDNGFTEWDDADVVVFGYDGPPRGESGYEGAPDSTSPSY